MWGIMPPLSEAEASQSAMRNTRVQGDPGHPISDLHSEVVELWPHTARGPGAAWIYRNNKSSMAKDLYSGKGQGILFARGRGSGFGITYTVAWENKINRATTFTRASAKLALLKFKPKGPRIGGPIDIVRSARNGVIPRCIIQVIAMSHSSFTSRSDGIRFVNSDHLAYNSLLNILTDSGLINTDVVNPYGPPKKGRFDGLKSRLEGERVMDISGFERGSGGGLAD